MKNILLEIINNDISYNKSATRYLYKTHSELWNDIVHKTNFLPDTALAKQRVWHIINDCYTRPTCPITAEYLKWRENCYNKSASKTARYMLLSQQLQEVTTGINHWRNKDVAKSALANKKFSKRFAEGKHKPLLSRNRNQKEYALKAKQTFLKIYGVDNPSKHPAIRKKISDTAIQNGATPKDLRSLRDLYYEQVKYHTEQNWKYYFDNINPLRLNRSEVDLDHIYSKQQGFRESIPPYIIGHWTNLQMLDKRANYSKGMACGKTQEKLFEDFFNNWLNQ